MALSNQEIVDADHGEVGPGGLRTVKMFEEEFGSRRRHSRRLRRQAPRPATARRRPRRSRRVRRVLQSPGDKKIQVIKEVRAANRSRLEGGKALVGRRADPVKEGLSREDADPSGPAPGGWR